VVFVPLTVAGQRWICTTFPRRIAIINFGGKAWF
jgi:hypothetical protein